METYSSDIVKSIPDIADQAINNSEAEADWIPQVSALLKSTRHNI